VAARGRRALVDRGRRGPDAFVDLLVADRPAAGGVALDVSEELLASADWGEGAGLERLVDVRLTGRGIHAAEEQPDACSAKVRQELSGFEGQPEAARGLDPVDADGLALHQAHQQDRFAETVGQTAHEGLGDVDDRCGLSRCAAERRDPHRQVVPTSLALLDQAHVTQHRDVAVHRGDRDAEDFGEILHGGLRALFGEREEHVESSAPGVGAGSGWCHRSFPCLAPADLVPRSA
jgi:hypothetical protein